MRARLREDLLDLVPCSEPCGHGHSRLEMFARTYGGRTLEILNVTVRSVTLRLSHAEWQHEGDASWGITQITVPHGWLDGDIRKDEFYNEQRRQRMREARS